MKATTETLHGVLAAADPPDAEDSKESEGGSGDAAEKTVGEFFSAGKAGDMKGAQEALHSYVLQCIAEHEGSSYDEDEDEPSEGGNPDDED